jgi:hypothetical protein
MLAAWPSLESLSTIIPLVPPLGFVVFCAVKAWVLLTNPVVKVHTPGKFAPKNV